MLNINDRVKVVKGCNAVSLAKGVTCQVKSIEPLGPDYSHAVKVVLQSLNGMGSGRTFVFFARHINRLNDAVVNVNTGNPLNKIQFVRKAA